MMTWTTERSTHARAPVSIASQIRDRSEKIRLAHKIAFSGRNTRNANKMVSCGEDWIDRTRYREIPLDTSLIVGTFGLPRPGSNGPPRASAAFRLGFLFPYPPDYHGCFFCSLVMRMQDFSLGSSPRSAAVQKPSGQANEKIISKRTMVDQAWSKSQVCAAVAKNIFVTKNENHGSMQNNYQDSWRRCRHLAR